MRERGRIFGIPCALDHIRIPEYTPSDLVHQALAKASQEAHAATAQGDESHLREIEERVYTLVAQLWDLTDKTLVGIRSDLEALEGDEV